MTKSLRSRILASAAAVAAFTGLAGCSFGPLADVASLSPAIQGSATDNETAFADASDQILLTNILRARDHAPLNMGALASINGALSLSGTAGFTVPFHVERPKGITGTAPQDSFAPSITGTTSPTYSFTPLNTQGFMLNAVQPVSASYVLNRWDAGLSREMLLLLFVKEIDFPVSVPADDPLKLTTVHYVKFVNDPDNPARFAAFKKLVERLLGDEANLKSFDIMDPVGPHFDLYAPTNLSGKQGDPPITADTDQLLRAQPNATSYGFVTGSGDGQYHVGNVVKKGGGAGGKDMIQGQLYRVYAGQVALCVNAAAMNKNSDYTIPIFDTTSAADGSNSASQRMGQGLVAVAGSSPSPLTAFAVQVGGGKGGGAGAGTPAATPTGGSSGQATTAALQAQRYSSIVDEDGCGPSEIVLDRSRENDFSDLSQQFVHIEWRSVTEVIEYLGAQLRNTPDAGAPPASWTENPASWVALCDQSAKDVAGASGAGNPGACGGAASSPYTLFKVSSGIGGGHVSVDYRSGWYSIADSKDAPGDQSMIVLSMLSTLVNLANQSSVTASAPFQLLPLP